MASELKKAVKAAEDLQEQVYLYDKLLDGLGFSAEKIEAYLADTGKNKALESVLSSTSDLIELARARMVETEDAYKRAVGKVAVLQKTEKIDGLRKAQPGLYVRADQPPGVGIYSATVYRYGGAGVWMESQKTIDLEDVPWPLIRLEVPGE